MRSAEVWLSDRRHALPARPERAQPAATVHLPSPALGDRGGGSIATDAKDDKGTTALEPVFLYDLDVPGAPGGRVGARVQARFDLGYEAVALQAWRRLRQMFLTGSSQLG
jgi:putative peptide zinc metalloprotease protein